MISGLLERLSEERARSEQNLRAKARDVLGVDEVGRGCLAGPVLAAAVYFHQPEDFPAELTSMIRDSKTLTKKQRLVVYYALKTCCRIGIAQATVHEIDEHNILNAALSAMSRAVAKLTTGLEDTFQPFALIDGNRAPVLDIPHLCVIKGDQHCVSIAAASIVAKTVRDRLMCGYHKQFPQYSWSRNAGYGTQTHRAALKTHGVTLHHRRSFRPVKEALSRCST
ncbi:MAG: ribonuclease HII [Alphaproteobacteria bacterium]|nr:ribonuclease HII [Alphaproteobacteria bacterium]